MYYLLEKPLKRIRSQYQWDRSSKVEQLAFTQ